VLKSQKAVFSGDIRITLPLLLILSYLILQAGIYIQYAYHMTMFPYDFDAGEGLILQQVMTLLSGESVYTSIDQEPYTVMNYPPLFEILLAGLVKVFGHQLLLGRLISVCATLLSAYLIGRIVFLETGRKLVATIAGLFFFSSGWLRTWSVLCRVDMLAVVLTLAGLFLFINEDQRDRRKYLCLSALCFVGALLTRQSTIAAPLSCFLFLLIRHYKPQHCLKSKNDPRRRGDDKASARRFIKILGITSFVLYALLTVITKGEFWHHITTYTAGYFSWGHFAESFIAFLRAHCVVMLLSIIFVLFFMTDRSF